MQLNFSVGTQTANKVHKQRLFYEILINEYILSKLLRMLNAFEGLNFEQLSLLL
jgi:hypothetical protein